MAKLELPDNCGSLLKVINTCIKCGSWAQMIAPPPDLNRVKAGNVGNVSKEFCNSTENIII
jgi:hypothetical protein